MTLTLHAKRILRRLAAAAVAAILACGAPGSTYASDAETQSPRGFERERVYVVPVQAAVGTGFQVDRVVIDAGGRRLGLSASAGVVRESQNRIRLRGLPIVGKLFRDRFTRSDFAPERSVGTVSRAGNTLVVELNSAHADLRFDTVVLVHDQFSYRFQGRLSPEAGVTEADAEPIGQAYAREGTLVILVRPSVITDSHLDF